VLNGPTSFRRAQTFPEAASFKIALSSSASSNRWALLNGVDLLPDVNRWSTIHRRSKIRSSQLLINTFIHNN